MAIPVTTGLLPFGWIEIPGRGVNPHTFLVYRWIISNRRGRMVARYHGSATDAKRPRRAYARNVAALRAGKSWHGSGGEFRDIHYCLAAAVEERRRVELTLRENATDRAAATALERRYQLAEPNFCECGPHGDLRSLVNTAL